MKEPTLGNPQNTIEVLQKYNFVFQKKFGQNFLIDTHVLDKIIRAAEITKDDFVLEIGPGIGTMTQYLACAAGKVAARNIDEHLGFHHKLAYEVEVPSALPNDRTPMGRVELGERPARERKRDFLNVETGMSREEVAQECGRCLRCDRFGCGVLEGGREQYA